MAHGLLHGQERIAYRVGVGILFSSCIETLLNLQIIDILIKSHSHGLYIVDMKSDFTVIVWIYLISVSL